MAEHNKLGEKGEQAAMDYLLKKGYTILERNYRFGKSEVDLIAQINDTLAVIEVKTRSTTAFGNPQDFVKPKQIQRLVYAINHYVTKNNLDVEVRFDIMALVITGKTFQIEHLKDAFYHF
ncbi:YraN family protein [Pseudotamlana carrageenivorans]|uniref:UPF0102 protein C1A40_05885 n=1 Tax=Pseudotamlana carrageenivorans TaxID=2069432 RepID=A0A2I7SGL4_9FLAO|nr:YraN family protein [Tamlana carrageenivorans]AUS05025.1 YraN family protein [Tamlana carrageenivorans]